MTENSSASTKRMGESLVYSVSSGPASSVRCTKPRTERRDFNKVIWSFSSVFSPVTAKKCLPMAGTRVALRRPRAERRDASIRPTMEAEEMAHSGICCAAFLESATMSASIPVNMHDTTARLSAPKCRRRPFMAAFVTTSSASSMMSACRPKQKAAATGRDFIIPGTGISSDMYTSTASTTPLTRRR